MGRSIEQCGVSHGGIIPGSRPEFGPLGTIWQGLPKSGHALEHSSRQAPGLGRVVGSTCTRWLGQDWDEGLASAMVLCLLRRSVLRAHNGGRQGVFQVRPRAHRRDGQGGVLQQQDGEVHLAHRTPIDGAGLL